MTPEWLAVNAVGGFTRDWAEIAPSGCRNWCGSEVGMEIVNDLIGVQTVLLLANCKALQRYW